ncbi:MAG TPA: PKD domain-containing protein [Terriglobales bacterium]|nr:PKD domain-containing protein [Terriglobales bacterium]
MRLRIGLVCIFLSAVQAFSATNITPTTTLAAESGNNTSAAPSFQAQSNGNATPGNVSKVATSTLLYSGSTTAVYAHFMPWFGVSYHMNVGYNSADPTQVKKQVDDMISRGIAGVIIDWYGPNASQENATTLAMANEAQSRNGAFQFAIMEDAGAISNCANTSGCDVTAALISDLNYITQTYISSPAYIRWNGNPVVFYFGVESYPIDWTRVRANTAGNLQFVFENDGGFTRSYSNGGFSWVQPSNVTQSDPMSLNYLTDFYSTAQQYPAKLPVGASYKGFNDTLASWSANRIMQQQCGQTWLSSFAKANSMWSTSKQLAWFQLVTWNDYEEATEIETGIDNCVSVNASVSGSTLNWSITGNENTLDHYTIFISSDGQNLMSLGDFPVGTHSLDLSSFGFNAGTYSVYVKAVGKPSILNHISAAATYLSGGGGQPQPPVARLSLSPGSGTAPLTVTASTSSSTDPQGSALTSTINFGDGASAAGPIASHTYANTGKYTVSATVTDALNLQAQATATVSVTANPTLTVTQPLNNSTVPGPIHVVANGSAPSGVDALQIYLDHTLVYQINASSMDTTVSAAAGTHLLVLKLWDKLGNAYMQSLNVTVAPSFSASLSLNPTTTSVGSSVTATVSSSSGTIASSQIAWGDGTSSAGPSASHVYAQAGTYTVSASATSTQGATAQARATVNVSAQTVTLNVAQPANGASTYSPIHVVASGSAPSGVDAMQIYLDGALVYQINAASFDTTVAASKGTHAVVVKLWDKLGNPYKKSISVTVLAPLVASLSVSPTTVSVGSSVQATVSAASGAIGNSSIYWGDGTQSPGPMASHTYGSAGTYTVTAQAADAVKSVSAGSVAVTVQAKAGVVMQSPLANSVVPLSMRVQGYSTSPIGIVAMQIYIDGALIYQNALSQVDTYLNVSPGSHLVALKAWDSAGAAYMQTATVTAQ